MCRRLGEMRVRLFPQIRLSVKVRKHYDHEEVLQESQAHDEREVGAVLHEDGPSEMNEQDEELELKWLKFVS